MAHYTSESMSLNSGSKLITICVPSYNVERYLDSCLQTIVQCVHSDKLEVLVVDDGSTDSTPDIAREYVEKYPWIVRLIQKENGGHGSAINRALKEADGLYFMVVDGDDWINSEQLDELLFDISMKKLSSDLIASNYLEVNMETGEEKVCKPQPKPRYFEEVGFANIDVNGTYFTLANSLMKTDILRKTGMQLQEKTFYVDVEYMLFPVPYIKTITFVDYSIYRYRKGTVSQSVYLPTMVKRYDHHLRVMKRVVLYREKTPMPFKHRQYYDSVLKQLLYTNYALFMIYDKDKQLSFARGREMDNFLCEHSPELAEWVAREIAFVKIARKKHFDYSKIKKSPEGIVFRISCILKCLRTTRK